MKNKDNKIVNLKKKLLEAYKNDPNKKILLFSFFTDTVNYIQDELEKDPKLSKVVSKAAFVSGSDQKSALHAAKRFAPKAQEAEKIAEKDGELNYLFSTDVLSEGQNLQDCGELINYDLHWNPVRMVQRNGRINRLGSKFDPVKVENYIPGADLEDFLGLMRIIKRKIELIKHSIGTDSSIFNEEIDPRSYTDLYNEDVGKASEKYKELEKDLDAFAEDTFLRDLNNFYKEASEKEIRHMERIPYGSWGILPHGLEDPNDVAVFSRMHFENELSKEIFFVNNAEISSIDMVPRVVALKMIRSEINEQQRDSIVIDKDNQFKDVREKGPQIALETNTEKSLTPTKMTVLSESSTHNWSADEKDKLRATLSTRNVHIARRVSRLVRSINAAINNNEPTDDFYTKLKEFLVEPTEQYRVIKTEEILGYTDQYKK